MVWYLIVIYHHFRSEVHNKHVSVELVRSLENVADSDKAIEYFIDIKLISMISSIQEQRINMRICQGIMI
jgi:hypothetical protein